MRGGEGFVGWGVHERFSATGPDAAEQIQQWFAEVCAGLRVQDEVGVPGSGPVAFVSLGFDDDDVSVAIVPVTVLGSAGGTTFITRIGAMSRCPDGCPTCCRPAPVGEKRSPSAARTRGHSAVPVGPPGRVSYADADLSVAGFTTAVTAAAARIRAGELQKVVLAHDLEATTARPGRRAVPARPARRGLPGLLDVRRRGSASAPARSC